MEALFELSICVLIGFKMLDIRKIWGRPEYVAFSIQIVFVILFIFFITLSLRFICFKEPKLIKKHKQEFLKRHERELNIATESQANLRKSIKS